jgi:CHASE2 domain
MRDLLMKKTQRDAFKGISLSRLGRAFGFIILAIICTYTFNRLGLLHRPERAVLDWEMTGGGQKINEWLERLGIPVRSGRTMSDIAVVTISNVEYNSFFLGHSPLDPTKLRKLVDAIARNHPTAIAVDIDTSHPDFRDLKPDKNWPPNIWERDILNTADAGEIEPTDILGGQDPSLNSRAGIPLLLDDAEDKETRLYTRCIETKGAVLEPSFAFAAAEVYRSGNLARITELCRKNDADSKQQFFIQWSHWRPIAAGQVLAHSDTKKNGGEEQALPALYKKLVLLGGTYLDVDRHFTPVGRIPGVFVLANAIQSELDSPVRAYSPWMLFILEFSAGTTLLVILRLGNFSLGKTLLFGLPMAFGLSLVFSLATLIESGGLQQYVHVALANFVPTLLAVLMFEIFEHMRREAIWSITTN